MVCGAQEANGDGVRSTWKCRCVLGWRVPVRAWLACVVAGWCVASALTCVLHCDRPRVGVVADRATWG